ncbi:MAG: hypothetical protein FWD57_15820, partial [Polyangiaceae bacterium]|nr:hypothetical protein [Polyangiaceae bacterium]
CLASVRPQPHRRASTDQAPHIDNCIVVDTLTWECRKPNTTRRAACNTLIDGVRSITSAASLQTQTPHEVHRQSPRHDQATARNDTISPTRKNRS